MRGGGVEDPEDVVVAELEKVDFRERLESDEKFGEE